VGDGGMMSWTGEVMLGKDYAVIGRDTCRREEARR